LKRPAMSFDVQIAHSVTEIGPEAWDRLSGDRPFASYRWYRLGEVVLTDDRPIYVVLSLGGEPVGGAALRVTHSDQAAIQAGPLRALVRALLRRWPLLLCQAPFTGSSGLILPAPPLRDAALETIARIAQDQARQHRVSFLAFPYLEPYEASYAGWPSDLAAAELPQPATCLRIAWPDFDSYLDHLSRKRRKHYRRHLRYADAMGIRIALHPTVTDVDEAMVLIRHVEERYSNVLPWTRRLLENANTVDAVWLEARVGDRLVGCELMLGDWGSWRVLTLGRDYDYQDVYFLLGYADIRYAIEHQGQALYWGEFAYDAKRRLGFQLESNNYIVFAGNGPLLHRFGRWMAAREAVKTTELHDEPDEE